MSELFTELSDQQQEIVAGGLVTFANLNAALYASDTELGTGYGTAVAGPGGAGATGGVAGFNQEILTASLSLQALEVD